MKRYQRKFEEMEMRQMNEAVEILDQNMDNPKVREELASGAVEAAQTLVGLIRFSANENVRLAAARDILDRSGYKPVERKDITTLGQKLPEQTHQTVVVTDEDLTKILDAYAKRPNAIGGPVSGAADTGS